MKTLLYNFIYILLISSITILLPVSNKNIVASNIYDDYLILVNKENSLDKNYIPNNLVMINDIDYIIRKNEPILLEETAYRYLNLLFSDAESHELSLTVFSGYRSYEKQKKLWNNNPDEYYVAKPGFSEHQTGLCVDISTRNTGLTINFKYTKEYIFLKENAYKYGFILRYPENKEVITGYNFEPWHYRFVGVENAKEIYNKKISLEEYLS